MLRKTEQDMEGKEGTIAVSVVWEVLSRERDV